MSIPNLLAGSDVDIIAQKLLGSILTTEFGGQLTSGKIVETEAYRAPDDKGSHAYGNRRTKRTETLFGSPGRAYVYLCYGIHHLFNVVSGPEEMAHAVLIRAVEPMNGLDIMMSRRNLQRPGFHLTNGPGKFTQALGIKTIHDQENLFSDKNSIRLELPERFLSPKDIIASPRVGIAYAKECAHWPWRFRIKDNKWTSLPDIVVYP